MFKPLKLKIYFLLEQTPCENFRSLNLHKQINFGISHHEGGIFKSKNNMLKLF